MRQGTTPKDTVTLPFNTSIVERLRVVYTQRGEVKIIKTKSDVEMSGNTITVGLSQEETLKMNSNLKTYVQVRAVTHNGEAFVSDIVTLNTERCLDGEVL